MPGDRLSQLQQQLTDTVARIKADLSADTVTAFVYHEETASFHCPAGVGLLDEDTFSSPLFFPRTGRVAGRVARTRREIVESDVSAGSQLYGPFARREQIRAAAGFPVLDGGRAIGVLFVSYHNPHPFDGGELARIARAAEEMAKQILDADPWSEITAPGSAEPTTVDDRLQAILDLACDAIRLSTVIWRRTPTGTFVPVAHSGITYRYWEEIRSGPAADGWLDRVVSGPAEGTVIDAGDPEFDPLQVAVRSAGWTQVLGVPILAHSRVRGVIEGLSLDPTVHPADAAVVLRFARLAGDVLASYEREVETQAVFDASADIERQSARVFDQGKVFGEVLDRVLKAGAPRYDFATLQLINFREGVIETVAAHGTAAQWKGRAKHYLEPNSKLRDIQADISLAFPLRIEVIERRDPRFDLWIFKEFNQAPFVRAFVPLVLAQDAEGNALSAQELDDWLGRWHWGRPDSFGRNGERKERMEFIPPDKLTDGRTVWHKVIGTVEAGYVDSTRHRLSIDRAKSLVMSAARWAIAVGETLLDHVLQTVVNNAVKITGARYASLHFDSSGGIDRGRIHYVHEVASGRLAEDLLKSNRPRGEPEGLGLAAIRTRATRVEPGPGKPIDDLKRTNPTVYDCGIRSIVAVPLLVGSHGEQGPKPHERGVLYVGFGEELGRGAKPINPITGDITRSLELLARSAADAIRHATAYTRMRDRARLLASLHTMARSLVAEPEDAALLTDSAWNALNILGADIVTIYEYDGEEFATPPSIAGRLLATREMQDKVLPRDSPFLLLRCKEPIFAEDSLTDTILNPHRGAREPFILRERVTSSAGLPLVVEGAPDGERVGVMYINYRRPHRFGEEERELIAVLGSIAAMVIKNRRLVKVFRNIDLELLTATSTGAVFDQIARQARTLTHAETGALYLIDSSGELRERKLDESAGTEAVNSKLRHAVALQVVLDGGARIPRFGDDPKLLQAAGASDGSAVAVRLEGADGTVRGVLAVFHSTPNAFPGRALKRLEGLAVPAAIALENEGAREQMRVKGDISTLGWLSSKVLHRVNSHVGLIRKWADEIKDHADPSVRARAADVVDGADQILEQFESLKMWVNSRGRDQILTIQTLDVLIQDELSDAGQPRARLGPPPPALVHVHAELLSEILKNAIQNALRVAPGGTVSVAREVKEVAGRSRVFLSIRDKGPGIHDDVLRLINTGQPIPGDVKTPSGLGLGLYLARTYIKNLGGDFEVRSEPGKGTEVRLVLPILPDATGPTDMERGDGFRSSPLADQTGEI